MVTFATALFPLGQTVATPGELEALEQAGQTPLCSFTATSMETGAKFPRKTPQKTNSP